MAQYKYSRDDYYRLTNAPCIDVALALGMEINERASDQKAWKMKDEQGLCIYREGNNWYRFSDGKHGFSIDLVIDKLGCSREQALDFIAKNVVNGVSEQVRLDHKAPANVKKELPKEKIFTVPAHDVKPSRVIGNAILKLIMKEQKAGHWNTSADNSFQAHNDTELPHDEAPPFFNDKPDSDQSIDRNPKPDPNNDLPHGEAPVSRKLYISSFAIREARNAVKDKDYDRSLELFSKEADKGNILAKYEIADLCRRNLCQGNAFEIYREALNGFLEIEPRTSQKAYVHYRIGRMFYDGYGTDIDYEKAFKWLKKAADEGNHLSEFVVGKMLCNGTGTERDTEAGTEYLTRAANSGNEYAQNYLDSRTFWEQGCVVKLVGSVGRLLSENLENSRAAMAECSAAVFGHGDLSKEQIRELILKKQDKENTAEM